MKRWMLIIIHKLQVEFEPVDAVRHGRITYADLSEIVGALSFIDMYVS